ncbi:MAG: hypothetical protein SCJ93_01265 [Bacillota bacterium]|nr:hypothetical protein [Bacillota bacterium]
MNNFRNKLANFMQGRYGVDDLYRFTTGFIFFLIVVNLFVNSGLLNTLIWATLVWSLYRVLSKDINKRRLENRKFMEKFGGPMKSNFLLLKKRFEDRKTHKYVKCKKCGTNLRFPKKNVTMIVRCPKCGSRYKI